MFDLLLFNLQATDLFFFNWVHHETNGKHLGPEETFSHLSDQDEIRAWMAQEPSQILLV